MTKPIIEVSNLGKCYALGIADRRPGTFQEALLSAIKAPGRRLRDLSGGRAQTEDFWALRNVSFDVQRGEVVGIIGRNGAGKSTLLKLLSRITEPTEGHAIMRGRVASLLEVGTGFHQELSGRENIYLNGSILGMKKREIDRRFDEIVDFAEVEQFLDTPVKRYSSGMYVRLAFAVAAHLEPEILIVDEVLAVGDAQFQKKCLGKMQDVSKGQGRTVLFVSHNMAAVDSLCGRAVFLKNGQVAAFDTTPTIIREYVNDGLSNAVDHHGDLTASPRASGLRSVIQSVVLRDVESRSHALMTGKDVEVEIKYSTSAPIPRPRFGLRIHELSGAPLFMLSTESMTQRLEALPASGVLHCRIPNLPLLPGTYLCSPGCASGGVQLDYLPDAVQITVSESNPFESGWIPSRDMGSVFVQAQWSVS